MSNMSANTKIDTLIEELRARILAGEFGRDGRLPSFRKLVNQYETSQETMNKAIQSLQAEGILISKGVKGVFVNPSRIRLQGIIPSFYRFIDDYGKKTGFEAMEELVTKPEIITPSKEIAKNMNLLKSKQVLRRKRIQGSSMMPFRIDDSYYPMAFINDKMLEQIYENPHYHIVTGIKENFKKTISHAREELLIRLPTTDEQEQLHIVRSNPVIDMKLTSFAKDETIILHSHLIFNANLFLFTYDYDVNYSK